MNFLRLFFAFLLSLFASDLVAEKVLNKNFDKLKHYSRKPLTDSNSSQSVPRKKPQFPVNKQINLLKSLLDTPPERLKIMRKTIERIESMNPEQKRALRQRLSTLNNKSPEGRSRELANLRTRHEKLSVFWQSLSPEKRSKEINQFQKLSYEDRAKYLKRINLKVD